MLNVVCLVVLRPVLKADSVVVCLVACGSLLTVLYSICYGFVTLCNLQHLIQFSKFRKFSLWCKYSG